MNRRGFSLLEILVVIVIIALLGAFAHTEYVAYVQRAKISEALNILEEYQTMAVSIRARTGNMPPYYVLFSDSDTSGFVSGSPSGDSATRTVDLKYVDNIVAIRGTSGGNNYILLGAQLQHDSLIDTGADFIYIAGIETPAGVLSWECGISASQNNTVDPKYLPQTCQSTLP